MTSVELTLTTPALLFPTVSLVLLAYTNRFLAVAALIRKLAAEYQTKKRQKAGGSNSKPTHTRAADSRYANAQHLRAVFERALHVFYF